MDAMFIVYVYVVHLSVVWRTKSQHQQQQQQPLWLGCRLLLIQVVYRLRRKRDVRTNHQQSSESNLARRVYSPTQRNARWWWWSSIPLSSGYVSHLYYDQHLAMRSRIEMVKRQSREWKKTTINRQSNTIRGVRVCERAGVCLLCCG